MYASRSTLLVLNSQFLQLMDQKFHGRESLSVLPGVHALLNKLENLNVLPVALAVQGLPSRCGIRSLRGTYADVFRVEYKRQQIAIKCFRSPETQETRILIQEVF